MQSIKPLSGGWGAAARSCDACKSASAAVYCRFDSAFLCITCDTSIHSFTRHERVYLCEVCEQAPAAVTCKADAASLCVTCDSDIHSANPLASRHERVPVESFFDSAVAKISPSTFGVLGDSTTVDLTAVPVIGNADELGLCPWLLPNDFNEPAKIETVTELKSSEFMFSDFDRLIDFEYPNTFGADSLVPVQTKTEPLPHDHYLDGDYRRATELHGQGGSGSERKNRKFEKTIRYASRKAYAESRPRIKGRFAKRTETENDDVFFSQVYASAGQYGVVPTF
ncbi:hypothetical protein HID58_004965 [Brassica napus]|uniref:Uncharacterized protein n=1 Tax=Brassica napus TaxID=3708 RepID=A0ABQ8E785_BRANA|nr:hypothetical protein HID58_004965 [Brassica napus]